MADLAAEIDSFFVLTASGVMGMSDNSSALLSLFGLSASGQIAQTDPGGLQGAVRKGFGTHAPDAQIDVTSQFLFPSAVAAGATWTSPVVPSCGMMHFAAAAKSTQNGTMTIQPYLDEFGLITAGSAITQSLTANTQAVKDNLATTLFQSFSISISNSGAVAATLSNAIVVLRNS